MQFLPCEELSQDPSNETLSQARVCHVPTNAAYFAAGDNAKNYFLSLVGVLRIVQVRGQGEHVVIVRAVPNKMFGIAKERVANSCCMRPKR